MKHPHPYIVLDPGMRTNKVKGYLVVHIREWVAISLHEKEDYVFSIEHESYPSAAADRDRLNHQSEGMTAWPCTKASPTASKGPGVSLRRVPRASSFLTEA